MVTLLFINNGCRAECIHVGAVLHTIVFKFANLLNKLKSDDRFFINCFHSLLFEIDRCLFRPIAFDCTVFSFKIDKVFKLAEAATETAVSIQTVISINAQ